MEKMEVQLANLQAWVENAARYKQAQQLKQQQQQQSKPMAAQSVTSVISEGTYSTKSSGCFHVELIFNYIF